MKYVVPVLLDEIKEKYEDDDKPISIYRLFLQSEDKGSNYKAEIVAKYEDLCVRLFDLDVSGWEVTDIEDSMQYFDDVSLNETKEYIMVTITMYRKL